MTTPPPAPESTILFRPSKKRKIYRQRATSRSPTPPPQSSVPVLVPQSLDDLIASTSHSEQRAEIEGIPVPISEILRLRKLRKGGVEFRADSGSAIHGAREEESAVVLREEPEALDGVARKFAPQTGTVGDVNKHM
ncbi:hypothetical protein LSUB1_G003819 [Lachnellula subtilissima]|uniref:Uncharacterized protein n=1 Tax=Lachnellula subtilissima TaxID=602034 RepID=A0A8H8U8N0_9HELO|nr:hypothetical protein LSUB1_G003819 [Lachnellula subtilissima]